MVTFKDAEKLAQVIESLENYAVADSPLGEMTPVLQASKRDSIGDNSRQVYRDSQFWDSIFRKREHGNSHGWGEEHLILECFLTEWVARVPGLFWMPHAMLLRERANENIESVSDTWVKYSPAGKTDKVSGGIGTLHFPPDERGYHLVTLTCSLNASTGIPALITDDVWQQLRGSHGAEGRHLTGISGRWERMGPGWAERFQTIKGIPQGYLIVNSIDRHSIANDYAPVQFHPCSVMEYEAGSSKLFDFVYATADSGDPEWRRGIEDFFESYRREHGRNGTYLTSADIGDPLWNATYQTPADLRKGSHIGRSQLELLEARIQERLNDQNCIEQTLNQLVQVCDEPHELQMLSDEIDVPRTQWSAAGSLADAAASFLAAVVKRPGKMEELVQRISIRYAAAVGE